MYKYGKGTSNFTSDKQNAKQNIKERPSHSNQMGKDEKTWTRLWLMGALIKH